MDLKRHFNMLASLRLVTKVGSTKLMKLVVIRKFVVNLYRLLAYTQTMPQFPLYAPHQMKRINTQALTLGNILIPLSGWFRVFDNQQET